MEKTGKSKELEILLEKLRTKKPNENVDNILEEIRNYFNQNETKTLPTDESKETKKISETGQKSKGKKIIIKKFGMKIKELSLSTRLEFDEIKKYLIFPLLKEKSTFIPLRSFSQLKKSKENPIIIEEGIDLTKFDKDKFKNIVCYLESDTTTYLYEYKNLTLNYLIYFPFLKKDEIYNKIYNTSTTYSQIDENVSKFEVLIRKYFFYGKNIYKFFIGAEKIGKTSKIIQIIHHNYLEEKYNNKNHIGYCYCYINLSLFYQKSLTPEDIYILLYDTYFIFFSHEEYISFIKDFSEYINAENIHSIFKIIKKIILYILKKYKYRKTRITFILDNIKKDMKNEIYDLIKSTDKLFKECDEYKIKIQMLFCGDFSFGEIYDMKINELINSSENLLEESFFHIIFDNSFKVIPESKQKNILDNLNNELCSYHQYYDIITKNMDDQKKIKQIKADIKYYLKKYNIGNLFLNKLLIEKCKINKNENEGENDISIFIDKKQENYIIENLPWSYFRILKSDINITGYNIVYRDNITKEVIEEILNNYVTEVNFTEYQSKPNFLFGYFFEEYLKNKFRKSLKFLDYKIEDVIIINSIYSKDEWKFLKKCEISKGKCYLIIQDLINAPYYDIALIIPKGDNFIILLIQITVKKSPEKRELLKIEYNYQRFLHIKKAFEKEFLSFELIDADFAFILFEKNDMDTVEFCIDNCIKCISYNKEGDNFIYWKDDLNTIFINKYPLDEFTLLNSINNHKLTIRKNEIKKQKEKKSLNLYNINPKTNKVKPLINLNKKERDLIKQTLKKIFKYAVDISLRFIENGNDLNIVPTENDVIVYIGNEGQKYMKIGFELYNEGIIKFHKLLSKTNMEKSDASYYQKYLISINNNFIGRKRFNTK